MAFYQYGSDGSNLLLFLSISKHFQFVASFSQDNGSDAGPSDMHSSEEVSFNVFAVEADKEGCDLDKMMFSTEADGSGLR